MTDRCGIFAFIGSDPDPDLITAVIAAATADGTYGHGWTVITSASTRLTRHLGRLDSYTADVLRDTRGLNGTLLGHTRPAAGTPENLQPIVAGDIAVVHHGTIGNPEQLWPGAPSGSVAFTRAYRVLLNNNMAPFTALGKLLTVAEQDTWAVAAADRDALYLDRRGLPLWTHTTIDGMYVASRQFHPDARLIEEDQICMTVVATPPKVTYDQLQPR